MGREYRTICDAYPAIWHLHNELQVLLGALRPTSHSQGLLNGVATFQRLSQLGHSELSGLPPALRNALKHHMSLAMGVIRSLIRIHDTRLSSRGARRHTKPALRKLWMGLKGESVTDFEHQINEQAMAIDLLLCAANVSVRFSHSAHHRARNIHPTYVLLASPPRL
jgi:hypothetical protein